MKIFNTPSQKLIELQNTHTHKHIRNLKNTIKRYLIDQHLLNISSNNCTVAEYTCFSSATGTFNKIFYSGSWNKSQISKEIAIVHSMFPDDKRIKLEINNIKVYRKGGLFPACACKKWWWGRGELLCRGSPDWWVFI